jgi:hypothetical protein
MNLRFTADVRRGRPQSFQPPAFQVIKRTASARPGIDEVRPEPSPFLVSNSSNRLKVSAEGLLPDIPL